MGSEVLLENKAIPSLLLFYLKFSYLSLHLQNFLSLYLTDTAYIKNFLTGQLIENSEEPVCSLVMKVIVLNGYRPVHSCGSLTKLYRKAPCRGVNLH